MGSVATDGGLLTTATSSTGETRERSGRFGDRHVWFALALYVAATVLYAHHVIGHLNSTCACGGGADPTQWMWMMEWLPYSIGHGLNPVISHLMWAPDGVDLAAGTSAPATAVFGLPFTLLFGPLVAYNVVAIAAPVAASWAAYRLCRYVSGAPWASMVGGYIYGFSAFELGQALGHLFLQGAMFVPPLIALVVLRFVRADISRRRLVIELVVLLVIEFGMSLEVLFTSTLTLAIAFIVAYAAAPEYRPRLRETAKLIVLAVVILVVITSYYIYELFKVPSYSKGWDAFYSADLLSYVFPTPTFRIGANQFAALSATFPSGAAEQNNYLGLPLILLLVAWMAGTWRSRVTKIIAIPTLVAAVVSLGDHLTVAGHSTIWMPFSLVANWPIFDLLLPPRIGVDVSLGAALGAALWISQTQTSQSPRRRARIWHWVVALAALAFLYPNLGYPGRQVPVSVPAFFTTHDDTRDLRRGEVVATIPYGLGSYSLLWQADTHMYFRLASGYFGYGPASYSTDPAVPELTSGTPGANAAADVKGFAQRHGVGAFVVLDTSTAAWAPVLEKAGFSASPSIGGVEVFRPTR